MTKREIDYYFSNDGTRNDVRMRVFSKLADEEPGTGSGDRASKYIYFVETLNSGNKFIS